MSIKLLFLDFDASSLNPSSYPIEVAYSCTNGAIENWCDWDEVAEEIHGISRSELEAKAWAMTEGPRHRAETDLRCLMTMDGLVRKMEGENEEKGR